MTNNILKSVILIAFFTLTMSSCATSINQPEKIDTAKINAYKVSQTVGGYNLAIFTLAFNHFKKNFPDKDVLNYLVSLERTATEYKVFFHIPRKEPIVGGQAIEYLINDQYEIISVKAGQ